MSKKKQNRGPRGVKVTDDVAPEKVKMVFTEHKYYNDLNKPIFLAGQVYEIEGAAWIARWIKRGGQIVEGTMPMPPSAPANPSVIVDPNAGQGTQQEGDNNPENGEAGGDADEGNADDGDESEAEEGAE